MILKWKTILTNWINCYTNEGEKGEHNITPENLLNIFTHIHESFRLDDSKSSKFEANTIQDFIIEKYPEFKFENGSLETTCEEEVYIVASLLLFFICVNSKNADIKRVMCSKLSVGDQETIMKFSKCLMDCSPILYADVEAAIAEACGVAQGGVAETPPALRSLHGEVRRLQAALDAERFDRNYLQDELARTNLKLEKLTKIKEQYKLDILSLKAKISLCCGEQRETHREARADEFIGRLQRQLQELEARLEDTLGQLEDAQQERDTYKKKVADLKQERDKWLSLSQQEADRACQLADQLDTERRTVATLRDLVSELRQHNRNNGLDSSMLECDDPDTSIQSLSNLSVCNEVCANVIEVQLGEERAKIEILKQQIQSLQEGLCKANQNFESEKLSLEAVITEKESNLFGLKQRVNEEIEEKSKLKTHYEQEIDKLNKKTIEMTLMIKDLEESSKTALAEKVQEIQLLHKRFAEDTDKLGIVIQTLQKQIEEENTLKKQRDEEIDKLNNKVVEMLQTIKDVEESSKLLLSEKEREIRSLEHQFANETERSNNVIKNLQKEIREQNNLKAHCEQEIVVLNSKICEISQTLKEVEASSKHVLEEKEQQIQTLKQQFSNETEKSSCVIENLQKEIIEQNNVKTQCDMEIALLNNKIVEMSETMMAIEEKSKHLLEAKLQEILLIQQKLSNETEKSNSVIKKLQSEVEEQNNVITHRDKEVAILNNKIIEITQKNQEIEDNSKCALEEKVLEILTLKQELVDETEKSSKMIETLQNEAEEQNEIKTHCEQEIVILNTKIADMSQIIKDTEHNSKLALEEKTQEIQSLQQEFTSEAEKSEIIIKNLEKNIEEQNNLKQQCDQEIVFLNNKIIEMVQTINNLEEHSKYIQEEKLLEIQKLHQQFANETEKSGNMIKILQEKAEEQNNIRNHLVREIVDLNSKIVKITQTVKNIQESSKIALEEKVQEMQSLQLQFTEETNKIEVKNKILQNEILEAYELKKRCDDEIVELNNKVLQMSQIINETEESSKLSLEEKVREKETLQLQLTYETEKSGNTIKNLNKELAAQKLALEEKVREKETLQLQLTDEIEKSGNTIKNLNKEHAAQKLALEEKVREKETLQLQLTDETEKIGNIIKNLNKELAAEKQGQLKLKEDFDSQIMALNDKILNQNKELADLNNAIIQKSQMIELMQSDLRKEKKLRDELSTTCNQQMTELNEQKSSVESEFVDLQKQLKEKDLFIDKLEKEVKNLNVCVTSLEEKCQNLVKEKQKDVESLNQEVLKLNNDITEMSQSIKHLEEVSKLALEEKVQEIGILHQQFAAESGKSENIIKNLKIELEAEKYAQLKLKDDFDNRIMKLNEKVLNRNNELVELQNNIIQKSELIEVIQSDLRREKELKEELSNTCNHQLSTLNEQKIAIENDIQQKLHGITDLQKLLQEKEIFINKLENEIDNLRTTISSLEEKGRHRDSIIKEKQKEIEFLNDVFQKELEKLNHKIDERNASIKSLQMQLQNEIEFKIQLQRELSELEMFKISLIEEIDAANNCTKDYKEKSLVWEKQKNEINERLKGSIHKVDKLEEEKAMLEKEMKALEDIKRQETKDHQEKMNMWEKQKIEMNEQTQINLLKIEKLEGEKALLLKEVETVKVVQMEEKKNYEEIMLISEKQDNDTKEQIQANILEIRKVEDDKALLLKQIEELKTAQREETNDHKAKLCMWEKLNIERNEEIQAHVLKVDKLEGEKAMLLQEVETLKSAETKNHEENMLTWNKQKNEMEDKMQVNVLDIERLKDEKAILMKEIEALKTDQTEVIQNYDEKTLMVQNLEHEKVMLSKELKELKAFQRRETKDYQENALRWQEQNIEMEKQIQDNILKMEKLEDDKLSLTKEIESLKVAQKEMTKDYEEKVLFVEQLEDEKATVMAKIEALKNVQSESTKDHEDNTLMWEKQKIEMEEQIQINSLKLEKLEDEKAMLMKEIEALKTVQREMTKDHEENALIWEKQKVEMEEQVQASALKVEKIENEKSNIMKEIEELRVAQRNVTQTLEEKALMLEKEKCEMEEQLQVNVYKVLKLENEIKIMKETAELITAQKGETIDYEEKRTVLEKEINEMKEKTQTNEFNINKLEEEKTVLLKELETVKAAEMTKTKDYEEKALMWEEARTEMNQQIQAKSLKIQDLEEEKEMIMKKVGELMTAEMEEICFKNNHEGKIVMLEKQASEMKEQLEANVLKMEKLLKEKVILLKEVEALKAAQKEMLALTSQDKITGHKHTSWEKEIQHQVDTTTSDLAHSSMESLKTISDLEKIVQDKNRKITTMQTEISYIKSMVAESGMKLIDVTKELEVSKDTCEELSLQLKKVVQQKNEEIAELKRQVVKMSATENRASQIIKVSAKYQAMILKRIAEIKSNAVLKELTNFGNQNHNGDSELRRSIAGSVTMEDLENFLETTDRHLKRCSEKQIALQKDRDRLSEVNRINESEIINMKKFLTEMSVSFRTFTTVKEVYSEKLSKIVSLQRTVRRDILSLDGLITEATMCKLERGYAAVMQDLSECAMNLERWVDRSVSRLLSAEKIKQAFTSDLEQASLSTCNYQNAAVEVQLSELENSFQKLRAEIGRAQKGEGARTPQEVTIMEVRAEYEDKLNRMKAKMKELFHEEMGRLKQKQAEEIAVLERELVKSRDKMTESSRAYEEHIRALTTELWSVGEKFLVKQEEADWLRKKQSGSLMSLQHVHSSGLHPQPEVIGRPSDTYSLRSLPMHNKKSEARGMHMSDEEGEVFDNRFLKELAATPRASIAPGQRISELKRRNSLVPPHLKSSYPAEMQFAPTLDEEDIKCASTSFSLGRPQRKEVGITAYKKPGPPTPSKQAGRLSATDSELRESLRVEADPHAGRKTSTPSRIRSLFRSNRTDMDVGTPRSRRFSSIFRKK